MAYATRPPCTQTRIIHCKKRRNAYLLSLFLGRLRNLMKRWRMNLCQITLTLFAVHSFCRCVSNSSTLAKQTDVEKCSDDVKVGQVAANRPECFNYRLSLNFDWEQRARCETAIPQPSLMSRWLFCIHTMEKLIYCFCKLAPCQITLIKRRFPCTFFIVLLAAKTKMIS